MEFESIVYMEWTKLGRSAPIVLSQSGMPSLRLKDLGLDVSDLETCGEHPYGYPPLLEAVSRRHGALVDLVVPAVGTSQALFSVAAVLLRKGDRVLVEKPAYEPLLAVPRLFGAEVLRFSRPFEDGYEVDEDEFRAGLRKKPKLVLLSNLHNPSGAFLPRERVRTLAGLAKSAGAWLCVDEVYLEFIAGEEGRTCFGLTDNVIVISSLTKVFGLGGLRCGWILAPRPLAGTLRKAMDYIIVEHVYMSEKIAADVYPRLDDIKEKNRTIIKENRRRVVSFIKGEESLDWTEPAAGIVCFPRVVDRGEEAGNRLADILIKEYGTSVVPGGFFENPQHFRLGFGVAPDLLSAGLANIKKALAWL